MSGRSPRHRGPTPAKVADQPISNKPGGPNESHRMLVLAICSMSLFIVGVDITGVNIALPGLGRDLHAGLGELQWVIDAYTIALASLLLLSGSTADRLGRRCTFQLGLAVFAAASVGCALAPTSTWLIIWRAVQGIGASMLNPVALSIIRAVFTEPSDRTRALGVWAGAFGVPMAAGPLVGGLLLGAGWGWRSIFWINVPLGVTALVLTAVFVPESRPARARRIDPIGQLLVIMALGAITCGVIEGPRLGWAAPLVMACFVLAAAGIGGLVYYEPRRVEPLLDPLFFHSAPFTAAAIICCVGFTAFGGFLWLTTLYLQGVRGYSALNAGLICTPMATMTALLGPVSGRLVTARGPRFPLLICGMCMATAAVMLTGLSPDTPLSWLLASYTIFGVGFAMLSAPTNNTALNAMPAAQAGTAAAITSTSRQVGQLLGVAILGSVLASGLPHLGFTDASHPGWWIVAGCGALISTLGTIATSRWAHRSATRTAVAFTSSHFPDDSHLPPPK